MFKFLDLGMTVLDMIRRKIIRLKRIRQQRRKTFVDAPVCKQSEVLILRENEEFKVSKSNEKLT
ncbi:CLUMA_CG014825, isoform A [Clunio marinus]|uniref:CLUMA_CG014825, isoform A n=1 Tax=Clunio marinus TaxID=568069 RepID=A0A1J1IM40_9DIPT|nr:CLUMA_CG014825, isoform A [Clunio marinus]